MAQGRYIVPTRNVSSSLTCMLAAQTARRSSKEEALQEEIKGLRSQNVQVSKLTSNIRNFASSRCLVSFGPHKTSCLKHQTDANLVQFVTSLISTGQRVWLRLSCQVKGWKSDSYCTVLATDPPSCFQPCNSQLHLAVDASRCWRIRSSSLSSCGRCSRSS